MTLAKDTILENRYRIDELLARGGMGAIYRGFDLKLQTPIAIKENVFQTPQHIRQFEQEALILARLRHSGLPRVGDHFSFEGQQYLVMDFIEGQDLWEIMQQDEQPLPETQAVDYIRQICDAVRYLHEQNPPIIHRDIKPQNIKITPDGRAVLVDFGIAKVSGGGSQTYTGARNVTPGYSPPEQYSGEGTAPASDIYALGATLYSLLTCQKPPDSISLMTKTTILPPPEQFNPQISPPVAQAIKHAMQTKLTQRPSSVVAWQAELLTPLPALTPIDENEKTTLAAPKFWLTSSVGHSHLLKVGSLTLGRSRNCDVPVNDRQASRQHATLEFNGQSCTIYDEGSANGTFINDQRVGANGVPFKLGDRLRIGHIIFTLSNTDVTAEKTPFPASPSMPVSPIDETSYISPIQPGKPATVIAPKPSTKGATQPIPDPQPAPSKMVIPQPLPMNQGNKGVKKPAPPTGFNWGQAMKQAFTVLVLLSLFFGSIAIVGGVATYFWIAQQLPAAETLRNRSIQFATTKIVDRDGNLLWEIIDPTGGRRTSVPLNQISPYLIKATVATEDRYFFVNVGVDPIAVVRAFYYNFSEGEIVSGGSTITQQLARNVLLSSEERTEKSYFRKVKEAILAIEIHRRYTKEQILEIYLNQIYYGNLAYGIEAASQTYFGKSALDLTLPEASMLAGLPQAPATHDPYTNLEGAKKRQTNVLRLMMEDQYITLAEAQQALLVELNFRKPEFALNAPHFVTFVRQELEKIIPAEYIYQAGLRVQTTLDPNLQAIAESEVAKQVDALANSRVTNGALLALDVKTGQILAMVGSRDFYNNKISGQVNLTTSPRQAGSIIKPLTYLKTFEQLNWTPSTTMMDVPVEYPDGRGGTYKPRNYDGKFHGLVSVRLALANSYNIPAIKALERVGVDALKEMATRLGITTLTGTDYGLPLALGSGEVSMLELTGAYQAMANNGLLVPPTAILQITDSAGRVIEPAHPAPRQVLNPAHTYLISHILADNVARANMFGANSPLRLSRPAAVKTGTTNDYRDAWTVGYTPDMVVGAWVGNANNSPMLNLSGAVGAAPIWHNFMERASVGLPVRDFTRPPTIVEMEVCADSGTLPSAVCPERRREVFFKDQPPLGAEYDIHKLIKIDRTSGLLANEFCQSNMEERYFQVYPPDGQAWTISQGIPQPPKEYCPATNIIVAITKPTEGESLRGTVTVEGSATAAKFAYYQIEVGAGSDPQIYTVVHGPIQQTVEKGALATFDTTKVPNGPYTLRLTVFNQSGNMQEKLVRVLVNNELPTATPTPIPTQPFEPTATPTETALPTATPTNTSTPLPLPTFTPLPVATATPLPLATATSTFTPVPPTTQPTLTFTPAPVPPTLTPTTLPATPMPSPTTETITPTVTINSPTAIPVISDTIPLPAEPKVIIQTVNRAEEYVELKNIGSAPQDLSGWTLLAAQSDKRCVLNGTLPPGQTLRIWALVAQAYEGSYNCGFNQPIWSILPNSAVLLNAQGIEVAKMD